MKTVQVHNATKNVVIAQQVQIAATYMQRMKGLLGRDGLSANEGLILKPCNSIHTFFMRFPIDVIFVDRNMRVNKLIQNMPSSRFSPLVWRSQMVIELPSGTIAQTNTGLGDTIKITV